MGRVIDVRVGHFRISGLVLNSDGTYYYNPTLAADGTMFCDCQGFKENLICSHVLALLRKAEFEGFNIEKFINGLRGEYIEDEYVKIYETSLKGYNDLFGGLQGGRHPNMLFSEAEIGKSYLNAQFCVDMLLKYNLNALINDTEGGVAPEWFYNIAKHKGKEIDVKFIDWRVRDKIKKSKDTETHMPEYDYSKLKIEKPDKPTIYIYDARHIVQVLPFFGRPISFKIKGGVMEPIDAGGTVSIWESPIGTIVEKCNIGYVANDSLSAPLEKFFVGGQINYRTRTKTTQVWLGRSQDLIDEYKIVLMNIAHATINHSNPYAVPVPVGGKAVLHNNKYIAFMEKYKNKKLKNWRNLRKMRIFRHMTKPSWSEECIFEISEHGFEDFSMN